MQLLARGEHGTASLTRVIGKADAERRLDDLLGKQVLLVEEEDDGGVLEPPVVADGVKQLHALRHAVLEVSKFMPKRSAVILKFSSSSI